MLCEKKLPFDLRHYNEIGYQEFLVWLTSRISTLSRTYMNQLYKQRRIGRSQEAILNDSAAISPIDLFWITRDDLAHTWDSLQILRDESMSTAKASLEGVIDPNVMFGKKDDHTSIFSTKGAFPKAVYKGSILKKGSNAEYEVVGAAIGSHLGIDVANAYVTENNVVYCDLFTSNKIGLVHASEYLYSSRKDIEDNIYEDALKAFVTNPTITRQLERLFILSYLVQNNDFHGENFGWLYDNETFEILAVAPAYDFNAAFETWDGLDMYDSYIYANLNTFLNNNPDLVAKLGTLKLVLEKDVFLNREQKQRLMERASYLITLFTKSNEDDDFLYSTQFR